ncbi:MAG: permease, partial [Proteobacteria bacterium]|nr:permease [Pseudomonadota bacterium]
MLARLQKGLAFGLLALAVLWAALAWRAGHPMWAVAGAIVVLCLHALVLGIEFVLLALGRRDDPAPHASAALLGAAWWGETCAAARVFFWRQPFRSRRWPDHLPQAARGRIGVLLV